MTAKSETPPEADTAEILKQLARAKATFQQRTVVAILTEGME